MNPQLKMGGKSIPLPASRIARIVIGVLLILFGMVGFLPILGFWMIPVGLLVLSVDLPRVRRWRRRLFVWWERWRRGKPVGAKPGKATGHSRSGAGPGRVV